MTCSCDVISDRCQHDVIFQGLQKGNADRQHCPGTTCPRHKQINVLSKCYSFQRNLWIDHLKPSIYIEALKQYFNRINDPSFSCFIPQGKANTNPTYDTPRTGSTNSSSCSGGKHRGLCHKSRCETENRVKVGWCMCVTVNAMRWRVIYYTIAWMCVRALSQHAWQNNDSYQTD